MEVRPTEVRRDGTAPDGTALRRQLRPMAAHPVTVQPMDRLPRGKSRWALAVLLGCVALLMLAPGALAAGGAGQITGTVTKAGSAEDLAGIEVCAFSLSAGVEGLFEEPERCVITGAGGAYTISELPSGEYDVEFFAPSPLNYVTQYYKDKPSFSEAQAVPVGTGVTSGIDAAMQVGGEIKGTVTEASTHKDLGNIEVIVTEAAGKALVASVPTEANGQYTVRGLPTGSYKVEFSPGIGSDPNFVTQFYQGASSPAGATAVAVTQGASTPNINAELQVGAEITGTVTDLYTRAPVAKVSVVAIGTGELAIKSTSTDASGQYTIAGLASGIYKIEFVSLKTGVPYVTQYYSNEPSLASANPVTASQGSTTPGISAALVAKAPVNTGAPVASGTPAVGKTLLCSTGTWTGEPTPTYTYAWLRNGVAIAGATGSTYVLQVVDQGTGLACRVNATNKNGSAGAVSNTLIIQIAKPPPPHHLSPEVRLLSAKILVSGGSARVPIACAKATCVGTIKLTERLVFRRRHGRLKKKTLVVGAASYALTPGQSATILVPVTTGVRHVLAAVRHHRLSGRISVSVIGGKTVSGPIVLTIKPKKHRRKHR